MFVDYIYNTTAMYCTIYLIQRRDLLPLLSVSVPTAARAWYTWVIPVGPSMKRHKKVTPLVHLGPPSERGSVLELVGPSKKSIVCVTHRRRVQARLDKTAEVRLFLAFRCASHVSQQKSLAIFFKISQNNFLF